MLEGTQTRLVFSMGANDTTAAGAGTRIAPDRSTDALAQILHEAGRRALPALVVGPPLAGDDDQHARIRALSVRFAAVAAGRHVPFIETAAHMPAASPSCGKHDVATARTQQQRAMSNSPD